MQRAYGNNATSTVPTLPASLQTGYPNTNGSTAPGYWWYYMVTESLMNLLTATGITPSTTDMTQITQAVIALAKANSVTGTLKPVRLIDTLGSVVYNGTQTIDGITPANGDRVLRNAPSTASPVANGIYIVNTSGVWARSADMAVGALIPEATMVAVSEGTANTNTLWALNPVSGETATINTTSISWNNITASTQALLSSYLKISDASVLYQTIQGAQTTYQTIANMANYLSTGVASSTYLSITNAASTYQTPSQVSSAISSALASYYTAAQSDARYYTQSVINSSFAGYTPTTTLNSTFLTIANAASTYQTLSGMSSYYTTSQSDGRYYQITAANNTFQTLANMSAYSSTTQMNTAISNALSNYYTQTTINGAFANYTPTTTLNANFITYTYGGNTYQTIANMANYQTVAGMTSYYTTSQTYTQAQAQNQINVQIGASLASYYTAAQSDARYYTQSVINSSFAGYTPTTTLNSTFLTIANAASTYQTLANMSSYVTNTYYLNALSAFTVNSLGVGTPASGTQGEIRASGNITGSYSDDRLKDREGKLMGALAIAKQLDVFFYRPNAYAKSLGAPDELALGMSAQQHEALGLSANVAESGLQDPNAPADEPKFKTLRYDRNSAVAIAAISELDDKLIAELKKRDDIITDLQEEMQRLIASLRRAPGNLGMGNKS